MPYDWYNIGKDKGNVAGSGLMSIAGAVQQAEQRKEMKAERKEEKDQRKGLALLSFYSDLAKDMEPAERMKMFSQRLLPSLVQSGVLPRDTDITEIVDAVKAYSQQDKKTMQKITDDAQSIIKDINAGNQESADTKIAEFTQNYGKRPTTKRLIEQLVDMSSEARKETKSEQKEIRKGILAGDITEIPAGQEGGLMVGKPTVQMGGRTFAGLSEQEKIDRAVKKTTATEQAKSGIQLEKSKKLEDYKAQIKKDTQKSLTDAQLLNALEKAEDAYQTIIDTLGTTKEKERLKNFTEDQKERWKVDWVEKNIANIEEIKNPKQKVKSVNWRDYQ